MSLRNYEFTLNNPTELEIAHLTLHSDEYKGLVFQCERGSVENTLHLQGYIEFNKTVRYAGAKRLMGTDRVHLIPRSRTRIKAIKYCQKDDSRVDGPRGCWGSCLILGGTRGHRSDLDMLYQACVSTGSLRAIADEFPSAFIRYQRGIGASIALRARPRDSNAAVSVIVYYGPSGVGKSRHVYEQYPPSATCFWLTMPGGGRTWWDGYMGEEVVVFNEFDSSWFRYRELLSIIDRYPRRVEFKGGSMQLSATKFIITCIKHPVEWYQRMECEELLRRISEINSM